VDVLLLYNTFRILGPAFDACSAASSRQRMSSFGFAGEREKYLPATTLSQRPAMHEKIHQYRAQNLDSPSSSSSQNSWTPSIHNLLPLHLDRHKSTPNSNSYSYTSTFGRPITPAPWDIALPPQAVTPIRQTSPDFREHCRTESSASIGLPAPLRWNHSPVLSQVLLEPPDFPSEDELYANSWLAQ
jgi:hypothetical protein